MHVKKKQKHDVRIIGNFIVMLMVIAGCVGNPTEKTLVEGRGAEYSYGENSSLIERRVLFPPLISQREGCLRNNSNSTNCNKQTHTELIEKRPIVQVYGEISQDDGTKTSYVRNFTDQELLKLDYVLDPILVRSFMTDLFLNEQHWLPRHNRLSNRCWKIVHTRDPKFPNSILNRGIVVARLAFEENSSVLCPGSNIDPNTMSRSEASVVVRHHYPIMKCSRDDSSPGSIKTTCEILSSQPQMISIECVSPTVSDTFEIKTKSQVDKQANSMCDVILSNIIKKFKKFDMERAQAVAVKNSGPKNVGMCKEGMISCKK